jgi:DNA-binding MarR family transcriptional regulator
MPEPSSSPIIAGLAKLALVLRQEAWNRPGRSAARKSHVTPTQGQVLAYLASLRGDAEHPGAAMSRIAAELAVTLPTVSEAVTALERKKLVVRARSAVDARTVLVALTAAGARIASRTSEWPDSLMSAVDALDDAERAAFLRSILKMIRSLQDEGRIPVARMCASCVHFRPNIYDDERRPHHCAFVDAPFGDGGLQVDCPDHRQVEERDRERLWQVFVHGRPIADRSDDRDRSQSRRPPSDRRS